MGKRYLSLACAVLAGGLMIGGCDNKSTTAPVRSRRDRTAARPTTLRSSTEPSAERQRAMPSTMPGMSH